MKIYAYLDKKIKGTNIREMMRPIADVVYIDLASITNGNGRNGIIPNDADIVVIHGVLRGGSGIIKQAQTRNIPWVMMDNGYLGKYKRVIFNATAPITRHEGQRFDPKVELEPWRGGKGDKIILLPPSPPYMDTFGLRDWLNQMAHSINAHTGKDVILRAKPAKGKLARPLQEHLDEAYAVVTWGSAVALEAMRQGIPTISTGWCPAKGASFQFEDLETDRLLIEPDRQGVINNLTWSSFDRNELHTAFVAAYENSKLDLL